jgi:hypothetical protein
MYNKLFTRILDSSIWLQPTSTRIVWVTFLAAMDEHGFCQFAAVGNVSQRAMVPLKAAQSAIECLEAPDPESSDKSNEGRRIERVPGGWIVLNAEKYQALATRAHVQEQTRDRVKRHRESKRTCNAPVTVCNETVTPSDTDTDTDTDKEKEQEHVAGATALAVTRTSPDALMRTWNQSVSRLPKASKMTPERRRHCVSRLQEEPSLTIWRNAFVRLEGSDFACGVGGGWRADFDFALKPGTLVKVLEGKYDNRTPMLGAGKTAGNMAALKIVLEQNRSGDAVDH